MKKILMTKSDERRERARQLVLQHGWNATAYQLVNVGISHWFSSRGDAVVGFVRKQGVFVVAGGPVCSLARLPEVFAEWEQFVAARGAAACYFGAAGRIESLLARRRDYAAVVMGAQPVWNPQNWAEMMANHKSLRAQLQRAKNKGVRVEEWPSQRASRNAQLSRCLGEWLQTRGLPSLHFLVEPRTLSNLEGRRIFVALAGDEVVGFLNASPIPRRDGWLTEQFVRGANAPNGTIELLVDAMMRAVAQSGACYATMGIVPLSGHADACRSPLAARDPLWLRVVLRLLRAHGNRFYNFQGLDSFKSKFRPERWEPIYVIAHERHFSPRSLYAIAAAFSGVPPWLLVASGVAKAGAQEIRWLRER